MLPIPALRLYFVVMGKFNRPQTMRQSTMKKALITTNIITAIFLIEILVTEKYPQRVYKKISSISADQKPHH